MSSLLSRSPRLRSAAVLSMLVFAWSSAACSSNGPRPARGIGRGDAASLSQVLFSDDLEGYVAVGRLSVERVEHSNALRVYVPIRNLTDRDMQLQVMCEFLDEAGNPYQDETGRKVFYLPRSSTKVWSASSMQARAGDFIVRIWRFEQ